jgi:hypothetical protein
MYPFFANMKVKTPKKKQAHDRKQTDFVFMNNLKRLLTDHFEGISLGRTKFPLLGCANRQTKIYVIQKRRKSR